MQKRTFSPLMPFCLLYMSLLVACSPENDQHTGSPTQFATQIAGMGASTPIDIIDDAAELDRIRSRYGAKVQMTLQELLIAGDRAAQSTLKSMLRSTDPEEQIDGLKALSRPWDPFIVQVDAEVAPLVYALVDEPPTRRAAIDALYAVDPQRAPEKLQQLLRGSSLDEEERRTAILALGHTPVRSTTIHTLCSLLQANRNAAKPGHANQALVDALALQYAAADSAQCEEIAGYLLPLAQDPKSKDRFGNQITQAFEHHPLPSLLPFFQSRAAEPNVFAPSLTGLAKLQGALAQPQVLAVLSSDEQAPKARDAIRYAWKGDPKGAVGALLTAYASLKDEGDRHELLDIAWQVGPDCAKEFAQSIPDAQQRSKYVQAFRELYEPVGEGHPLVIQARKVAATGLVTRPITPQDIEAIRQEHRESGDWDWDETFVEHIGSIAWFDAETGVFPSRYDELLLKTFVPASQGKLQGLECYMTWTDPGDEYAEEEVWVIFRGRGYHFIPAFAGDWYDLDAVGAVLTRILEDAGMDERFVKWESGDQMAGYVFATPSKAREVIKQLDLDQRE